MIITLFRVAGKFYGICKRHKVLVTILVFAFLMTFAVGKAIVNHISSSLASASQQNQLAQAEKKIDEMHSILANTSYQNQMTWQDLMVYYNNSKAYGVRSIHHDTLIKALCEKYISKVTIPLNSILFNNELVSMPDSSFNINHDSTGSYGVPYSIFEEIDSLCNSVGLKTMAINFASKYIRVQKVIQQRLEIITEQAMAIQRKKYAEELRNQYLDDNLDIKVTAYGPNNTILKLSYPLFNDVWSHKMENGDVIEGIKKIGFKRFEMSDGYDWGVYWNFNE
jgi:hypothetical protein